VARGGAVQAAKQWWLDAWARSQPRWLAFAVSSVVLTWTAATLLSVGPEISSWGHPSRQAGLWTQTGHLAVFAGAALAFGSRTPAWWLSVATAAAAAIAATYALLQRVGIDFLKWGTVSATGVGVESLAARPAGTFGNPNYLSAYLALAVFMTVGGALSARRTSWRLALGASAALQLLAILFAQTRGAWVGIAAGTLAGSVLLVAQRGGHWRRWLVAAAVLALLTPLTLRLAAPILPHDGLAGRLASIVDPSENTASQRLILWRIAAELWTQRPLLGYGPETFEAFSERRLTPELSLLSGGQTAFARAENGLLDTLFSVGALGTIALLALLALVLSAGIRAVKPGHALAHQPDTLNGDPLTVGMLSALFAHLITQQFGILEVGAATLASMAAGSLVGAGLLIKNPTVERRAAAPPAVSAITPAGRWATPAVVAAVIGLALWWESRPLRANLAYSAALAASRADENGLEQSLLEDATRLWPHNYRYWVALSEAQREAARLLPEGRRATLFARAVTAARRAWDVDPADPVLQTVWADAAGEAAAASGDAALLEHARRAHAGATSAAPGAWELWQSAGITEYRFKQYGTARTHFQRAADLFPRSANLWAFLGDSAALSGDPPAARAAYRRSLDLDPTNDNVRRALASTS